MNVRSALAMLGLAFVLALAGSCVVYEPYPYPSTAATYDRSWYASLGALRDQGVQVDREDRGSGVIEGRRGGIHVKALVVAQADGRVRVEFNTGGNLQEDPGLSDRISRAYDSRMGR